MLTFRHYNQSWDHHWRCQWSQEMPVRPMNLENLEKCNEPLRTYYLGPYLTLCYSINCHCICIAFQAWEEERRKKKQVLLCNPNSKNICFIRTVNWYMPHTWMMWNHHMWWKTHKGICKVCRRISDLTDLDAYITSTYLLTSKFLRALLAYPPLFLIQMVIFRYPIE